MAQPASSPPPYKIDSLAGLRTPWKVLALVVFFSALTLWDSSHYSYTYDEPSHLACGMEYLSRGVYRYEAQHPPLARVALAIGPYLDGARSLGEKFMQTEGVSLLDDHGSYTRRLLLARLGILPFFWLAAWVVYLWGRRWFGELEGLIAVMLFCLAPPVLAHAGLATTDMALTAMLIAGLYTTLRWLEEPNLRTGAWLGLALAGMALAKFSALAFYPAALVLLALFVWRWKPALRWQWSSAGVAALLAVLLIWAAYRFSFGPTAFGFSAPAPEWWNGIAAVRAHNAEGHPAYLLGSLSNHGFWLFYPVALAVKTPLLWLALALWGLAALWQRRNLGAAGALALAAGTLAVAMAANINIGIRHILPVYAGLALAGAAGFGKLRPHPRFAQGLLWALFLFQPFEDRLAYFNWLALGSPEKILVDSDLDWGQDSRRLGEALQARGAREVAMFTMQPGYLERFHGIRVIQPTDPTKPLPGYNAVSLTLWKSARFGLYSEYPDVKLWPDRFSADEKIGAGLWLYHFQRAR